MGLHEAIGALVGAGVGALDTGTDARGTAAILDEVAAVLEEHPADLPGALQRLSDGTAKERAVHGARMGVSAIPLWDRLRCTRQGPFADRELMQRAVLAWQGKPAADQQGWPAADHMLPSYRASWPRISGKNLSLPQDEGLIIGDVAAIEEVDAGAVVSLCRMGTKDVDERAEHIEVWLVDENDSVKNPNLDFVIRDVTRTLGMLRDEGKTVLLHCVQAESRTPSIAAAYLCERFGLRASEAFEEVGRLLPNATPKPFLRHALERLWPPV